MHAVSSAFVWAALSAVFAAMTAIFAKQGLQGVDPDWATLIRTVFILFVLAGFIALTGNWTDPTRLPARSWLFLGLSSLATGASWVCYFRALHVGAVSLVAPVDKFSIVLAVLFAVAFLGERPSLQGWAGIGLISLGVIVLAFDR